VVDFFGGENGLLSLQKRDKEKNQYCLNKNIILYRIPYNELKNISTILQELLIEKSSTTIERFKITK